MLINTQHYEYCAQIIHRSDPPHPTTPHLDFFSFFFLTQIEFSLFCPFTPTYKAPMPLKKKTGSPSPGSHELPSGPQLGGEGS